MHHGKKGKWVMHKDELGAHKKRLTKGVRAPLTVDEIFQLDAALMQAFGTIQVLRNQNPVAKHIKLPPLPAIFTESIVIASASRLFGPNWVASFGGRRCDVVITNHCGETKAIEIKATGEHAFQEFKSKDLRADILVWIRFGRRFQEERGQIEIALLTQLVRFISSACRLDTIRFERRIGSSDNLRIIRFDSLEQLLGVTASGSP